MSEPILLTEEQVLKPITWHTASVQAPVWTNYRDKLLPGVILELGRTRVRVLLDNGVECHRPYAEVYWRKDDTQASKAALAGRPARRAA